MRSIPLPRVVLLVVMLILGVLLGQWMTGQYRLMREAQAFEPRQVAPRGALTEAERLTVDLFKNASPSVVYITTVQRVRDLRTRDQFDMPTGTGSGFIWDELGHVVTNFHVVQGVYAQSGSGASAVVTLSDQTTYAAKIVGVAPNNDLAVLKIEPASDVKLQPIMVGSSNDLEVGQNVYAIGNPFGLDRTLTTGTISALGRSIKSPVQLPIEDVIQTDAAINPGNSGGPLLDSAGRLIGVNTQIASAGAGQSAGIGFAVPVDIVNRVVPELIRTGRVARAVMGVSPLQAAPNQELTRRLGLSGVMLTGVSPGSPAEKAGVKASYVDDAGRLVVEDLIVEVNGRKVVTTDQFQGAMTRFEPGQSIKLKLWNRGNVREVEVTLVEGR